MSPEIRYYLNVLIEKDNQDTPSWKYYNKDEYTKHKLLIEKAKLEVNQ